MRFGDKPTGPAQNSASNATAKALVEEGIALRHKKLVEAACSKFEEALRLHPDFPPAQQQLASLLLARGNDARAIDLYHTFLRSRPQVWRARLNLAHGLTRVGRYLEAADAYLAALEIADEEPGSIGDSLLNLLYRRWKFLSATIACDPFPNQLTHRPVDLCRLIGDAALAGNLIELALASYGRALNEGGEADPRLHKSIGKTLVQDGREALAEANYERALALAPNDCETMFELGVLARHRGDHRRARTFADAIEANCPETAAGLLFAAVEARDAGDRSAVSRLSRAAFHFESAPKAAADEEWRLGMRVARVHQARLMPMDRTLPVMGQRAVAAAECLPEYAHHLKISQSMDPKVVTDLDAQRDDTPPLSNLPGVTLYAGLFFNHFGHFMAESPHRLWAFEQFRNEVDHVAIICQPAVQAMLSATAKGTTEALSPLQREVLDYLGVPVERIRLIDATTTAETLLIPESGSLLGGGPFAPSRGYIAWLSDRQRRFFASYESAVQTYPEKLYVGRGHLIHLGGIAGEGYFERLMAQEGFHMFRPEQHSLFEQMNHYRHASEIVFSEGSAVHGLELLGVLDRQPRITILARRPHFRGRWDGLIRTRTPHYRFFAGVHELPALGLSGMARLADCGLAVVHDPEVLANFLREFTSANLSDFDSDAFQQQEAIDVARYLLHVKIPRDGASQLWSYLAEFRARLTSISHNPYLMNNST